MFTAFRDARQHHVRELKHDGADPVRARSKRGEILTNFSG